MLQTWFKQVESKKVGNKPTMKCWQKRRFITAGHDQLAYFKLTHSIEFFQVEIVVMKVVNLKEKKHTFNTFLQLSLRIKCRLPKSPTSANDG